MYTATYVYIYISVLEIDTIWLVHLHSLEYVLGLLDYE